jgi:biopolymer transport protein ExbD
VTLPDKTAAGGGKLVDPRDDKPMPELPLGMIVSVTKTDILVWSISQREGTLTEPRAKFVLTSPTAAADLAKVLAPIATQHPNDKTLILQADGAIPLQQVVEMLAAIKPVFPDVVFSSGFE